jgi:hypothetical protein
LFADPYEKKLQRESGATSFQPGADNLRLGVQIHGAGARHSSSGKRA